MAAASNKPHLTAAAVAVPLVIILLLIIAAAMPAANASALTIYQFPGCVGQTQDIAFCNACYTLSMDGGYKFDNLFNRAALLYDTADCSGLPSKIITQNSAQCSGVLQKSAIIACYAYE